MPSTLTPQQLQQQLSWRYATKKFDASRKIPAETWSALEQAMLQSPSSFGLQPWKFIVVRDPALRETLKAQSWNQPQVTDASHFVVFAAKTDMPVSYVDKFISRTSAVRNVPGDALAGYRNMIVGFIQQPGFSEVVPNWNARQAYLALGFFLLSAATLGVDACPLEGINPPKYTELLGLSGYQVLCAAAAGYRAADDQAAALTKVRFPASDIIEYR